MVAVKILIFVQLKDKKMGKIASHLGVQNRALWSAGSLPSMTLNPSTVVAVATSAGRWFHCLTVLGKRSICRHRWAMVFPSDGELPLFSSPLLIHSCLMV